MDEQASPKRQRTIGTQVDQTMLVDQMGGVSRRTTPCGDGGHGSDEGKGHGDEDPGCAMASSRELGSADGDKTELKDGVAIEAKDEPEEKVHPPAPRTGVPEGPAGSGSRVVDDEGNGTVHALQEVKDS